MIKKTDLPKYQRWRIQMSDELRRRGITDAKVLEVMKELPRHWFCDTLLDNLLHQVDQALPIGCGQTISQPLTVARQTELLMLQPGMKVLEIGTGSGYQTAVLCKMGAKVFSIERQKELFDKTKPLLHDLGFSAKCFLGDGYQGLTEVDYGLFDRVIVTCGASVIPTAVMNQMVIGGVMVIPVGGDQQEMLRVFKEGSDPSQWRIEQWGGAKFVPMLEGKAFRSC